MTRTETLTALANRGVVCSRCSGLGHIKGPRSRHFLPITCPKCNGFGRTPVDAVRVLLAALT